MVYASVVIEPRQKRLFRVQNWDRSSSSCDFLFRREKEGPSSVRTVPAASASTLIVVPATVRSYVHRLCHRCYCCWTREVANSRGKHHWFVVFLFVFLYFFIFWMSWLWCATCLLWVRVSNVCVEVAIWLTVVQSWVVSRFLFRYGVEERLYYVADGMNEGVIKLFRRVWWSKMVVTTQWRHLGFEWWLGFLIWEKVEDDDVAHCGWCKCVYKDHGYMSCYYWVRK